MQRFIEEAKGQSYTVEVAPLEAWTQRLWHKIVFRGAPEYIDAIARDLSEKYAGQFEFTKSSDTFFEVGRLGCSKGTMLEVLRRVYEVRLQRPIRTYGVGNHENDLSLLDAADVAVCPSDAIERVRAIADRCLCAHDEGTLADLIKRL